MALHPEEPTGTACRYDVIEMRNTNLQYHGMVSMNTVLIQVGIR